MLVGERLGKDGPKHHFEATISRKNQNRDVQKQWQSPRRTSTSLPELGGASPRSRCYQLSQLVSATLLKPGRYVFHLAQHPVRSPKLEKRIFLILRNHVFCLCHFRGNFEKMAKYWTAGGAVGDFRTLFFHNWAPVGISGRRNLKILHFA